MDKTHYRIDFMMHDFDYIDHNNFISCWSIEDDFASLQDAIKKGYEYKNKKGYYSFYIVKDNDLNQFLFDSHVYDETGKYKAEDQ